MHVHFDGNELESLTFLFLEYLFFLLYPIYLPLYIRVPKYRKIYLHLKHLLQQGRHLLKMQNTLTLTNSLSNEQMLLSFLFILNEPIGRNPFFSYFSDHSVFAEINSHGMTL